MAKSDHIDFFVGTWTIAEFRCDGHRISPLGDPDPPVSPGHMIAFKKQGDNLVCDLSELRGPNKVPYYWHGREFEPSGEKFTGELEVDHTHKVTLRKFEFAQRGKPLSGIECTIAAEGATHMGVWHAPD